MISLEKPGTPSELVHHGVKGQRWGVRNRKFSSEFNKQNPTSAKRRTAILDARHRVATQTPSNVTEKDKAIARRLTTGEKATLSVLAATGFFTIPIIVGVSVNSAVRRSHERNAVSGH